MTSKNAKRPSVPLDQYFTPTWLVKQCVEHILPVVLDKEPRLILEPGAGTGQFVSQLRAQFPNAAVHALDIDENVRGFCEDAGATKFLPISFPDFLPGVDRPFYQLACGNPPFTFAREFIENSLRLSEVVVMLVRQGFMSSAARVRWFRENRPTHVHLVANRPSYGVPESYFEEYPIEEYGPWSGDSADYCFISWRRGHKGGTVIDWLPDVPLEERREG